MALYAMGDFHLSFAVNKPMDGFLFCRIISILMRIMLLWGQSDTVMKGKILMSFHGEVGGIIYHLVSSDYLRFRPKRIL